MFFTIFYLCELEITDYRLYSMEEMDNSLFQINVDLIYAYVQLRFTALFQKFTSHIVF